MKLGVVHPAAQRRLQSAPGMHLRLSCLRLQITPGPKALMHPDVEAALPGNTYNALTRKAGELMPSGTNTVLNGVMPQRSAQMALLRAGMCIPPAPGNRQIAPAAVC